MRFIQMERAERKGMRYIHLHTHLLRKYRGGGEYQLQKNVENDNRMRHRKKPRLFAFLFCLLILIGSKQARSDCAYACVHIKNTVQ